MKFSIHGHRNWHRSLKVDRVYLDGADVTRRCQIADTRRRRVYLLDLTKDEFAQLNPETHNLMGRWHYGKVRIILKRKNVVAPARPPGDDGHRTGG